MLLGHIDGVSANRIGGWAFDTECPDEPVNISIYVDGYKAAEVTCDRDRSDLQQAGKYGDGRHGFSYWFDPPLSIAMDRTVTVRHTLTGLQVANGRHAIGSEGTRQLQGPVAARVEQNMRIPGPTNARELLELLALYDDRYELYDLLANVEFDAYGPRETYYCVFDEYPNVQHMPKQIGTPRDMVNYLMLSSEFQINILPIFLRAYIEKKRLLFIHIPKCAGSDLSMHLTRQYPTIGQRISDPAWTSKKDFLACLHDIILRTRFSSAIYVRDHINLEYYSEHELIRPGDEVFTILRDPSQIPISQVNYILTRFSANRDLDRLDPDTAHWLEALQLDALPDLTNSRSCRDLSIRILRDQRLVPPNPLCHWLGGGSAATVLERLATHRIEATETKRYNAWLQERWGITSSTRDNASKRFISTSDLGSKDIAYIGDLIAEDMALYGTIDSYLSRFRKNSINCASLDSIQL